MKTLTRQRVLLIAPRFFGYEFEIQRAIERLGATVDLIPDRPFDSALMVAATRFAPRWALPRAERVHRQLLDSFGATHYDAILVVNGQTLTDALRRDLRRQYPAARWVLYMWDSLRNRPGTVRSLGDFDAAFTFDPQDAHKYAMGLRPLFFGPRFDLAPSHDFEYHLSFVGTAHTDRYPVIRRLRRNLDTSLRAYWYLYLQAPWVYQTYRLTNPGFRGARQEEFSFVPLPKQEVSRVFSASRAIVDVEHPNQRGLTMRTIEAIGANKKLISTNSQVREYDFYRPANICVIDRHDPRVPAGFLETPIEPLPPAVRHRLSIAGWVEEVLDATPSGAGEVVSNTAGTERTQSRPLTVPLARTPP